MAYDSWKAYFASFPGATKAVFLVMTLYLLLFTLIAYRARNHEFFFYAFIMFCFFLFIISHYH